MTHAAADRGANTVCKSGSASNAGVTRRRRARGQASALRAAPRRPRASTIRRPTSATPCPDRMIRQGRGLARLVLSTAHVPSGGSHRAPGYAGRTSSTEEGAVLWTLPLCELWKERGNLLIPVPSLGRDAQTARTPYSNERIARGTTRAPRGVRYRRESHSGYGQNPRDLMGYTQPRI